MGVMAAAKWFGDVLRAIPGPTDAWASIIGDLAWPVVVAFLVIRYRRYLRLVLDTILARLETDHVKLGPFELTPNYEVLRLDPDEVGESTSDYSSEDIVRIEKLCEFIADEANLHKLALWVNDRIDPALIVSDFLTLPEHAIGRAQAYDELVERRPG